MKWGLALSGGSALGMANAGVLERLEEEGLRPDCVGGTSMGAIVGALYALGHPPSAFRGVAEEIRLWNIVSLSDSLLKGGLHGGFLRQRLRDHLQTLVGSKTIGDCRIPFLCTAGRVKEPIRWERIAQKGFGDYVRSCIEVHIFSEETLLLDALMASSAIPVVFSPVTIGSETFIDLCNFCAIPVRPLRTHFHPDVVIATDTIPRYKKVRKIPLPFFREWMEYNAALVGPERQAADLIITPRPAASSLRFDKFEEFRRAGYEATEEAMPKIRKIFTDIR